jgi:hypothetical protein
VVYVADATTGKVAAYTIPWNSSAHAAGTPQYGQFQPLDVKEFRTAFVRDEPARTVPEPAPGQKRASDEDSSQRRSS